MMMTMTMILVGDQPEYEKRREEVSDRRFESSLLVIVDFTVMQPSLYLNTIHLCTFNIYIATQYNTMILI